MQKITHASVGLLAGIALGLDPAMTLLGALLPDLDYVCCHRKLLHNVWVVLLALLYSPAMGIGVITHLLLDSLTVSGVALLWPISNKRFGVRIFRTGGIADWLIFFGSSIILTAIIVGIPIV